MKKFKTREIEKIDLIDIAYIIQFIVDNSDIKWDDACDISRDILSDSEYTFFSREDVEDYEIEFGDNSMIWVKKFYEAYPKYDNICFLFTD